VPAPSRGSEGLEAAGVSFEGGKFLERARGLGGKMSHVCPVSVGTWWSTRGSGMRVLFWFSRGLFLLAIVV
jgi:hypothetical protein